MTFDIDAKPESPRLPRVFWDALYLLEDMQVVRIFQFHIAVDL